MGVACRFVQWQVYLSAGYELQGNQRLKSYADDWFEAGFVEKLSQNSLSLHLGFAF